MDIDLRCCQKRGSGGSRLHLFGCTGQPEAEVVMIAGPSWRCLSWQWPLWLTQALLAAAWLLQPRLWARVAKAAVQMHRLGTIHPLSRPTHGLGRESEGQKSMARQEEGETHAPTELQRWLCSSPRKQGPAQEASPSIHSKQRMSP